MDRVCKFSAHQIKVKPKRYQGSHQWTLGVCFQREVEVVKADLHTCTYVDVNCRLIYFDSNQTRTKQHTAGNLPNC